MDNYTSSIFGVEIDGRKRNDEHAFFQYMECIDVQDGSDHVVNCICP